jgi:phosphoglycerol transferase MdoB-like AlkP superfamily enzyme
MLGELGLSGLWRCRRSLLFPPVPFGCTPKLLLLLLLQFCYENFCFYAVFLEFLSFLFVRRQASSVMKLLVNLIYDPTFIYNLF